MNPEATPTPATVIARKSAPKFRVSRDQIRLENDIPPPEACIPNSTGRATYPVAELEQGQSFSFPAPPRHRIGMLKSATSAIGSHVKNHPHKQFVARALDEEGVVRVWRLKDKPQRRDAQTATATPSPAPQQTPHREAETADDVVYQSGEESEFDAEPADGFDNEAPSYGVETNRA